MENNSKIEVNSMQTLSGSKRTSVYNECCALNIIDLNDDCLEEIFIYLTVKELFDLVSIHSNFVSVCLRIFHRKYRKHEINISSHNMDLYKRFPRILKSLSNVITSLRITFDRFDVLSNELIHRSIMENCDQTLCELTLNNIQPALVMRTTFPNLKKMSFNQGRLTGSHIELQKCFPNIRCLQLFFCQTEDNGFFEQTLPTLEEFTVAHHNSTFGQLSRFLELNPQLKSFIVYNYNQNLIGKLSEYAKLNFQNLHTTFEVLPCYFAFAEQ